MDVTSYKRTHISPQSNWNDPSGYKASVSSYLFIFIDNLTISTNILHRNMLLTKENKLKLADFGLSKLLASGSIGKTYAGTPAYMSPELIRCKDDNATYSYKTDIWFDHTIILTYQCMLMIIFQFNYSIIGHLVVFYLSSLIYALLFQLKMEEGKRKICRAFPNPVVLE